MQERKDFIRKKDEEGRKGLNSSVVDGVQRDLYQQFKIYL